MNKDETRRCLYETLMSLVAPSMDSEERRDMLDCFFPSGPILDDETLDALAQSIAPPPREFFAKWIMVFVDKALAEFPPERLQAVCGEGLGERTRLYLAYLQFSRERQADMDRDLEAWRMECLTRTRQ